MKQSRLYETQFYENIESRMNKYLFLLDQYKAQRWDFVTVFEQKLDGTGSQLSPILFVLCFSPIL